MKQKVLTIGLILLAALLCLILFVKLRMADRVAPEITYENKTLIYDEKKGKAILLEDVDAWDAKDGDVKASLIIKDLYPVSELYGIVVYAAKDSSNNVVTATRGFLYSEPHAALSESEGNDDLPGQASASSEGSDALDNESGTDTGGDSGGAWNEQYDRYYFRNEQYDRRYFRNRSYNCSRLGSPFRFGGRRW